MDSVTSMYRRMAPTVGAMPPPEGVTPNFVDPEWNGKTLEVLNIVLFAISFFFVTLRLYTRLQYERKFGWDDCMILYSFSQLLILILLSL